MQVVELTVLVAICATVVSAEQDQRSTRIEDLLWPLPANLQVEDGASVTAVSLSLEVIANSTSPANHLLQRFNTLKKYQEIVVGNTQHCTQNNDRSLMPSQAVITSLSVFVASAEEQLSMDTDESYSLDVQAPTAYLSAATVYGAMRGLETFTQLVVTADRCKPMLLAASVSISDAPRFPWRGLLVDTSRHFQPVEVLKQVVDGLAMNKMNVLHWHMVDAQSFPVKSNSFPELSKGAYDEQSMYTLDQLREIVEHGKSRGVRVMAEIDIPGHANSWGSGFSEMVMHCNHPGAHNRNGGMGDVMNPASDKTWQVLNGFIDEMCGVFPEQFFHIGGDEVLEECWDSRTAKDSNPKLSEWMQTSGVENGHNLRRYFTQKGSEMLFKKGRRAVLWDEAFDLLGPHSSELPPSQVMFEVWREKETINSVTKRGYDAITAHGWYLDHHDVTCESAYMNDPVPLSMTDQQVARVKGGEAAMWTEWVDSSQITKVIFPRLLSVAEKLWSHKDLTTDFHKAKPRLSKQLERLNVRGLQSAGMEQCSVWKTPTSTLQHQSQRAGGSGPPLAGRKGQEDQKLYTTWQKLRFPDLDVLQSP